jgi:hypothetical protein
MDGSDMKDGIERYYRPVKIWIVLGLVVIVCIAILAVI